MGLLYYPNAGEILVCRYDDECDVIEPELCKPRPAVVVGPRLRGRARLVTVVPLSTTEPETLRDYHCRVELDQPLPPPFDAPIMWAKCDMVSSVSLDRLDRFKEPYQRGSARKWRSGKVAADKLKEIKVSLLCGLGFQTLTNHL